LYALPKKEINPDLENKNNISLSESIEDEKFIDQYILDTGDVLFILFRNLNIFSGEYLIDRGGYLDLPEIGKYYVRGNTISEIIDDLNSKYEEFIFDPSLKIKVRKYRPVKVFISGEIANPGLYNLTSLEEKSETINTPKGIHIFPRLFNLLRASGGVTNYSDLSKIEVIRTNPSHSGGGKKKAKVNLLDLILKGDQVNNIYLFDDDIVFIPKSEDILIDQILAINKVNLNPSFINIFVSGNVTSSGLGPQVIKKGTSLNQAIAFAGGKKLFSGNIEFVRFKDEGNVERRIIRYNSKAKVNSFNNPVLMEGDIINIRRTPIGVLTEVLNEFAPPIFTGYSLIDLFGGND
tara:strand:- start:67 stop:1113 length:1047 start_codon:yes stop_codon:yes gene_type:complete